MAYTDNTVGTLDTICETCTKNKVGTLIDKIIAGTATETLTATQEAEINNMCQASKNVSLGTILKDILDGDDVDLTDTQAYQINHICEAFRIGNVGTKLQSAEAESTAAEILTFYFTDHDAVTPTIDSDNATIAVTLPSGTNRSALVANFTLSAGASAKVGTTAQVSGTTSNSFTSPVTYKVTAEEETVTKDWTVTVTLGS